MVDGAETTVEGLFSFELEDGRFRVIECGWREQVRLRAKKPARVRKFWRR